MKSIIKYSARIIGIVFLLANIGACTPEDHHYKDFMADADKTYPGRVDDVKIKLGFKRAIINGKISSDPKVKKIKVFWNNKQSEAVFDVLPKELSQNKEIIVENLKDGYYNFQIQTLDSKGNHSVPVETSGYVYGDEYHSRLIDRGISATRINDDGDAEIVWENINDLTLIGTEINYTGLVLPEGEKVLLIKQNEKVTILSNYQRGDNIEIRTLYKPNESIIDTVYTAKKSMKID